jgi:hypothetical protein
VRCLLVLALLLSTVAARADSLADLRKPSFTISGCTNDWGPVGTGTGVAASTCEDKDPHHQVGIMPGTASGWLGFGGCLGAGAAAVACGVHSPGLSAR